MKHFKFQILTFHEEGTCQDIREKAVRPTAKVVYEAEQ